MNTFFAVMFALIGVLFAALGLLQLGGVLPNISAWSDIACLLIGCCFGLLTVAVYRDLSFG